VISPLLANVYLHYAYDLRVQRWRKRHAHGAVIVVRGSCPRAGRRPDSWAIVGFQFDDDARSLPDDLRERLAAFALDLHAEKTRLIVFGRFAQGAG
jgi:RNA-directed DNA polymerase